MVGGMGKKEKTRSIGWIGQDPEEGGDQVELVAARWERMDGTTLGLDYIYR